MTEFVGFPKIARLIREAIITEKIDGTNACIYIGEDGEFLTGSRNRWITPKVDNFGFSAWAHEHRKELMKLGPGRHYGEWWGQGIQRGYGLADRRFSLFDVRRWCLHDAEPGVISSPNPKEVRMQERLPACVGLVPVLDVGLFSPGAVECCLDWLRRDGSKAAPGWPRPEGVVIYHIAGRVAFKRTIEWGDGEMVQYD